MHSFGGLYLQLWLFLRCITWLHEEAGIWRFDVEDTHYAQLDIIALTSA